ncbi:hypothetical protein C8D88_12338 [Lentzea atacamensis]|uniref:Uncharacterized protein n=1 Tax=Lentzea atacamensis TaxID=531938 RepID=A0A316HHL7_9PSEU|nr:hypothetical protein [Lentzea atacamensis]PWK80674.1 hypothetical protein C8D88_12338 [Lentzea atacamensis]
MSKRMVVGLVLALAAFAAIWASGLASADESEKHVPSMNEFVPTADEIDTVRPPKPL